MHGHNILRKLYLSYVSYTTFFFFKAIFVVVRGRGEGGGRGAVDDSLNTCNIRNCNHVGLRV